MKKLLLVIFLILAFVGEGWGASYYAQGNCEITACEWDTTPTGGGSDLTWASLANGDDLYANGKTITIENNVGSGSVTANLLTTAGAGTAGGTFTFDVSAVAAKTLYVNLTAGAEHCLQISGGGSSGTELTIIGNITGSGTTASKYGVYDAHTGSDAVIAVVGNLTGGSSNIAHAYHQQATSGTVNITGTVTAGSAGYGFYKYGNGSLTNISGNCVGGGVAGCVSVGGGGLFTVTGDCVASGSTIQVGCHGGSPANAIKVVGNIVGTTTGVGVSGAIQWFPGTLSSDYRYIKVWTGTGTNYNYVGLAPAEADVETGVTYVKNSDGTTATGTLSASGGGGGAWGF